MSADAIGGPRRRPPWRLLMTSAAGLGVACYFLLPFLWLVITSFMSESEALSVPPHWWPHEPTVIAYAYLFDFSAAKPLIGAQQVSEVVPSMANSLIVALSVAMINLLLGVPAAYSLARLRFPGSGALLILYIATRMVPVIALMIPLYMWIRAARLLDTPFALILTYPALTLPLTIWILKSYFETVPRDLEDAARVDRCNWLQMMRHVFLPVTMPGLIAAAVFSFMFAWSEFLFALLFTSTLASKTVTVAIAGFISDLNLPRTVVAAAGVLAALPPVAGALFLQRLIVQGLVSGAVKG